MKENLKVARHLHVQQVHEGFEIVLGWETRNKYRILDESMTPVGFAAEVKQGVGAAILKQFLGHWRKFDVTIFDQQKKPQYHLHFPFRWFFKTLFIRNADKALIGHLQQRFAIFRKKFDLYSSTGQKVGYINSSFFKFWTFDIYSRQNQKMASIKKKWSGVLSEVFTDKDNFVVEYYATDLSEEMKAIILSTCLMVDIIYFENNEGKVSLGGLFD